MLEVSFVVPILNQAVQIHGSFCSQFPRVCALCLRCTTAGIHTRGLETFQRRLVCISRVHVTLANANIPLVSYFFLLIFFGAINPRWIFGGTCFVWFFVDSEAENCPSCFQEMPPLFFHLKFRRGSEPTCFFARFVRELQK